MLPSTTSSKFNELTASSKQKIGCKDEPESPSFSLFTQLRSEIRQTIWRLALPAPRLISISSDDEDDRPSSGKAVAKNTTLIQQARCKFYGLFYACQESRSEFLKFYQILAPNPEADVTFGLPKWAIPPYVSTFHDIFFIPEPREGTCLLPANLMELLITYGQQVELLRTIATSEDIVRARDRGVKAYGTLNRLFPGARRLVLLYVLRRSRNADGIYVDSPPYEGHGEAIDREYQAMRVAHPEWGIEIVEVRSHDGEVLPTVPLPVVRVIDLDVIYKRDLAI